MGSGWLKGFFLKYLEFQATEILPAKNESKVAIFDAPMEPERYPEEKHQA